MLEIEVKRKDFRINKIRITWFFLELNVFFCWIKKKLMGGGVVRKVI